MSDTNFDRAFAAVIGLEGGYVNDPRDPGGKTRFGISDRADGKIDGMADLDRDGRGDVKIEVLTTVQAKAIYRRDYWDACRCAAFVPARSARSTTAAPPCSAISPSCAGPMT